MKKAAVTPQAFSIVRTLHIIAHQTDEIFDALLRTEFKLTLARFRIMLPLVEIGPMTQADIARFHFLTEASIARQVKLLVDDGFLRRLPDCTDGRKFVLTFTKKTETLLPTIKARLSTEIDTIYSDLSPTELISIEALLHKLRTLGSAYTSGDFVCPG